MGIRIRVGIGLSTGVGTRIVINIEIEIDVGVRCVGERSGSVEDRDETIHVADGEELPAAGLGRVAGDGGDAGFQVGVLDDRPTNAMKGARGKGRGVMVETLRSVGSGRWVGFVCVKGGEDGFGSRWAIDPPVGAGSQNLKNREQISIYRWTLVYYKKVV